MATEAKVAEIQALVHEIGQARSVLLADFTGMDVATLSELRRRCRAENITFRVAKNTLTRRALDEVGMGALDSLLEGPTGIAIGRGEELAAARVLMAFAKEKELLKVKGGLIDGRLYTVGELKTLATLPARNELLSHLLMVFQTPVTQVIGGLSRLASDLMSILDQLAERKGGAAGAAAAAGAVETDAPAAGEAGAAS